MAKKPKTNLTFINAKEPTVDTDTVIEVNEESFVADDTESPEINNAIENAPEPVSSPQNELVTRMSEDSDVEQASERALTGKRPSMRPPRRNASSSAASSINPLIDKQDVKFQRESPEESIEGIELEEDIKISFGYDALITLIRNSINKMYKKDGLRVSDELYSITIGEDSGIFVITVKMKRIPYRIVEV